MLFYNLNFHLKGQFDEGKHIPAIILNPTGYDRSGAFRRTMKVLRQKIGITRLLLDPQLYFLDLQRFRDGAVPTDTVIRRIETYSWLGVGRDDLESGELRQEVVGEEKPSPRDLWEARKPVQGARWETTVRAALGYQLELDCDTLILPAPLYGNHASTLDEEMDLLRQAISVARALNFPGKPIYASVPLADSLFLHGSVVANRFIDGLVDNVSAIPGVSGVYIPYIQNRAAADRIANEDVAHSLLRMAKLISNCTDLKAIFNFIEDLGLLCRALGAEGYATGPSKSQRQFTADEFLDGIGKASPKFFSLQLCADFRPENEIEWIRDAGLLPSLEGDRTEASEQLFRALEQGNSVGGNVPEWAAESRSLVATRRHYFEQQVKAIEQIRCPSTANEWITSAAADYEHIKQVCLARSKSHTFSIPPTHHQPWKRALQAAMALDFC
jgi:hypothetical protein